MGLERAVRVQLFNRVVHGSPAREKKKLGNSFGREKE
jgi:hypothetical protein